MTIDVTAEDIRYGVREHSSSCAVARAVKRATGGAAKVSPFFIYLWNRDGECSRYTLAISVAAWILRFDEGSAVTPITFRLLTESGITTEITPKAEPVAEPELELELMSA